MSDPIIKTYSDKNIKFKFNEILNSTIDAQNAVGATTSATLRTLNFTPSDSNSIYVAKAGSNANAGTSSAPVLTLTYALSICTGTKTHIVIKDSGNYEENLSISGDAVGIYAALGQTPTLTVTQSYNDASYSKTTSATAFVGPDTGSTIIDADVKSSTIVPLSDNRYCVIGQLASSMIFHVIDAATNTQIHEYTATGFTTSQYFQGIYADVLYNGYIIAASMDMYPTAEAVVYDPETNTKIDHFHLPSYYHAICLKRNDNEDNIIVNFYNAGTDYTKLLAYIYDVDAETTLSSGLVVAQGTILSPFDAHMTYIDSGTYVGKYLLSFVDGNGSGSANAQIINNDATLTTAATLSGLPASGVYGLSHVVLTNDNALYIYKKSDNKTYFKIITMTTGAALVNETELFDHKEDSVSWPVFGCMNEYGNIIASINKVADDKYYYAIISPTEIYYITLKKNFSFEGVNITCDENFGEYRFATAIKCSSYNLVMKWCTIYGFEYDGESIVVSGTGTFDIENCKIYDNENIFTATNNTFTFKYNLIYNNNSNTAVKVTGAGAAVSMDHCTFYGNYKAIELISNAGTEIVKNSIFRSNINGGVDSDSAISITYSCNTDTNVLATLGSGCLSQNPQFVNLGLIDPDDIDFNLKSAVLGYSIQSPCIQAAELGEDMGCYDVDYIYLASTYTEITVPKPLDMEIDLEAFNQIVNEMQDGSIQRTKDGNQIVLKIKWKGLLNEYASQVLQLFDADGAVYVYFEPDTDPTTYHVMQVKSEKLSISPKFYKHSRYGVQDIEITLLGKYS